MGCPGTTAVATCPRLICALPTGSLFEGEPWLGTSLENTFPDSFSDVNSEDMRRPVPDWVNHLETEEDFQYPRPEEYELLLHPVFDNSDQDAPFGPQNASNLRRVTGDVRAATPPVLSVVMPWELPGISFVIGEDEPAVPTPVLYTVRVADEEVPRPHPLIV